MKRLTVNCLIIVIVLTVFTYLLTAFYCGDFDIISSLQHNERGVVAGLYGTACLFTCVVRGAIISADSYYDYWGW